MHRMDIFIGTGFWMPVRMQSLELLSFIAGVSASLPRTLQHEYANVSECMAHSVSKPPEFHHTQPLCVGMTVGKIKSWSVRLDEVEVPRGTYHCNINDKILILFKILGT
eukprot:126507-Amphidinium_carterae.1